MHFILALITCTLLAYHGIRKKSLSPSGAIAACLVGFCTFIQDQLVFTVILLSFYLSSSKMTKIGSKQKRKIEEDFHEGLKREIPSLITGRIGGQRTAIQVFSNGATGTAIALLSQFASQHSNESMSCLFNHRWSLILLYAYVGHYACCNGDTWASELGTLSKSKPFLITSFKKVPTGTNGGVSLMGLLASIAGGAFIGLSATLAFAFTSPKPCVVPYFELIVIGTLSGFIGSLIDSILGATLQLSLYNEKSNKIVNTWVGPKGRKRPGIVHITGMDVLDNHQVNFISSLLTALLVGIFGSFYFT